LKKYLLVLAVAGIFAACGGGSGTKPAGDTTASASSSTSSGGGDLSANPDYVKGLDLIGRNDCLTCHDIATKKIGPAYQDVAKKYAGVDTAVDYLAKKIVAGGSGVWGTVPMTPHPALALDSAKALAKYVLLLKAN
jgi:cytochrome c